MNVKKEMPTGNVTVTSHEVPTRLSAELTKNPAYLKYARRPTSNPTASARKVLRAAMVVERKIASASTWFTTVDAISRNTNRQSHQA